MKTTPPQIMLNSFKFKRVYLILLTVFSFFGQAQLKLGTNAQDVNPNAILELETTNKGILIPRMSDSQRDAAFTSSIPNGLLIYNNTENCFQYYQTTNNSWSCMGGSASGKLILEGNTLSLNGTSVTLPSASGELKVESGTEDSSIITLGDSPPVILKAGSNISLSESGNTITLTARSSGGGGGTTAGPQGVPGPPGPQGATGPPGPQGVPGSSGINSQTLTLSNTLLEISGGNSVNLSSINSDDQQITTFTINASNTIILELEDGGTRQLTLPSTLASGTLDRDSQTISLTANVLSISNGNSVIFPATTDSQTLSLSGNILTLTDGGSADLSLFTNTDSQTISGVLSGTDMLLKLTNIATQTIDLSPLAIDTNTDSQTISGVMSGTQLLLSLDGTASTVTETIELASLITTTSSLDSNNNFLVGTEMNSLNPTQPHEGRNNLAFFDGALEKNVTGHYNMAIGENALRDNTHGFHNLAIGESALLGNDTGRFNIALGSSALFYNYGNENIGIGGSALYENLSGDENVAIGLYALYNALGYSNTALGYEAGFSLDTNNGDNNTFIGAGSDTSHGISLQNATAIGANAIVTTSNTIQLGDSNVTLVETSGTVSATAFRGDGSQLTGITTTSSLDSNDNFLVGTEMNSLNPTVSHEGRYNLAFFDGALEKNITGYNNIAIGEDALRDNTRGRDNLGIGSGTLSKNKIGAFNIALGSLALFNNNADDNIGIGYSALTSNLTGNRNVAIGFSALNNALGSNNIALGNTAGFSLNTNNGDNNTFIGAGSDTSNGISLQNATAIGANAIVTTSNTIQLGDSDVTLVETSGTVSATAFRGDGSQLTNLPPTSVDSTTFKDNHDNIAIGTDMPLINSTTITGKSNIAIGNLNLNKVTDGDQNVAIGDRSLQNVTTGSANTASGNGALSNNITGSYNTAYGHQSLVLTTNSFANTAYGTWSLRDNSSGNSNTGLGTFAGGRNTTGSGITAVGYYALLNSVTGSNLTVLGAESGKNMINGNMNVTLLGAHTETISGTVIQNSTAIGANAIVNTSSTFVMGDENVNKWAFGLPTTDSGNAIQVGDDTTNGNGASLTSAGVWTNASSILFKTNFIDLDNEWILNKINSISVKKWDYKNTNETHIGPTSEEFIETFGVGNGADTSHLGAIDVSGVALKGVQALIEKVETLKEKVEGLKIENSNYQNKLQKQELLLQQLMTRLEALENQ